MEFDLKKPDLVQKIGHFIGIPIYFTGLVELQSSSGEPLSYTWYDQGLVHKDMGPAILRKNHFMVPETDYYLWGALYNEDDYWKEMYLRHKGTDQEEICLIKLLGAR